ncbi:uncharacterized protein LOC126898410 [Daktulosphaira vitifoliae]|uniref:uncharacterized protein LOC126898410 n=1 Tax=Daktulosphaira vitifoliae TaxID=58002 RepID=UPI0021AA7181|nr:uncharacterized protein LOC126898410 [Daktulosphaira vitifoliae]
MLEFGSSKIIYLQPKKEQKLSYQLLTQRHRRFMSYVAVALGRTVMSFSAAKKLTGCKIEYECFADGFCITHYSKNQFCYMWNRNDRIKCSSSLDCGGCWPCLGSKTQGLFK